MECSVEAMSRRMSRRTAGHLVPVSLSPLQGEITLFKVLMLSMIGWFSEVLRSAPQGSALVEFTSRGSKSRKKVSVGGRIVFWSLFTAF